MEQRRQFFFRRAIYFLFAAIVGIGIDQVTKMWARHHLASHSDYLGSTHFGFSLTSNSGSAFSFLQNSTLFITVTASIISFLLFCVVVRSKDALFAVICGAIAIGALGNIVDRFTQAPYSGHGHVTDFIQLGSWPTFNVGDIFITLGAVALVIHTFFLGSKRPEKK